MDRACFTLTLTFARTLQLSDAPEAEYIVDQTTIVLSLHPIENIGFIVVSIAVFAFQGSHFAGTGAPFLKIGQILTVMFFYTRTSP